jgi:iron complex transport system substrate-binding protein
MARTIANSTRGLPIQPEAARQPACGAPYNDPMSRLLLVIAWLGLSATSLAAVEVVDDLDRRVALPRPAQRIVSLAPHATELLFAAGAGARVVGVAAYSDFPPEAARLPQVGDAHALDLERIVAMRPDLVVAWASGNSRQQVERLAQRGIAVFYSEPGRLPDIAASLERLGELAGTQAAALAAAARLRGELAALEAEYRGVPAIRLYYEIWHSPPMTVSGRHFVSDALARCGFVNVFAALEPLAPAVSLEAVIAARPQAIATGAGAEAAAFWRGRRDLAAPVCEVDPSRMHRPGPRLAGAAREVCACLDAARRAGSSARPRPR